MKRSTKCPYPIACGERDIHEGSLFGDGGGGRPGDEEKTKWEFEGTGRVQKYTPIPPPPLLTAEPSGVKDIVSRVLMGTVFWIIVLVILGVVLFLVLTFRLAGWKSFKWAWE